ncbi:SIMPL domain-containing protein [bacterium]|nr:SIMPL domain-containing protein [bacterium]
MNEQAGILPLPRRTIQVSGTAKVTLSPDVCYMTFTVESEHKNAAKAYKENNKLANQIISRVKTLGIESRDIKSFYFSIMPYYKIISNTTRQVIDGYRIFHYLMITARDLALVSDILDLAVEAGATGVHSINFTVEEPKKHTADARIRALEAAKQKAEKAADILGFRLGTPVSVSENEPGFYPNYPYYAQSTQPGAMREYAAAQPQARQASVEPGETSFSVTMHVVYEIEPL